MFSIVNGFGGVYRVFDCVYAVPAFVNSALAVARYTDGMYILSYVTLRGTSIVACIDQRNRVNATVADEYRLVDVYTDEPAVDPSHAALHVCEAMAVAAAVYEQVAEGRFDLTQFEEIDPRPYRNPRHAIVIDGFVVEIN